MCNLSEGILERGIEQGIEQGLKKGATKEKERTVINAYKMNLDIETMKGLSGLSEEEIRQILKANGYEI